MKASELIALLQNATKDGDCEVEFLSEEWTEDLEDLEDQERFFRSAEKKNGKIHILLDRP